jgi:hypothetical protein
MARQVQPGTPSRSLRYIMPARGGRLTLWSLLGAAIALVLGVGLYAGGMHSVASPGRVASPHATLDARCTTCHQTGHAVTETRCERCHDPLDAHRLDTRAHAALGGGAANAAYIKDVQCASCHSEHRGRNVDLSRVSDRSCTSCHAFGSFTSHPEIAVVRAKKEADPGLDFSHEVHLKEVAKKGGDRCQSCHQLTADQRTYLPISFDAHCAGCHLKDRVLTLNGTDALKSLPTPATLLPASVAGAAMPVTESKDERGRVVLTGFSHRDPWVLAAADQITRMMDTPAIRFEREQLVRDIERVSALAQAVPASTLADADLAPLAAALTSQLAAIDQQLASGQAGGNALQTTAAAVDPSLAASAARLGARPAISAAPSDAQQLDARRKELAALLDAIGTRADAKTAARVADLKKQLDALKPDTAASNAVNGVALMDRLKAVDLALHAVETAAGPGLAADVQSARDGVTALVSGAPGAAGAQARHDALIAIDAIAARGNLATRARAAELRTALASLPDEGETLAQRRADIARLLERVNLELELRPTEGAAPVDAISQTERAIASQKLQQLRARLATLDARIGGPAELDTARGRAALHGLLDACVKCHRLADDETALRPVVANQSLLHAAVFTHKPHLLQAKCETCHASVAGSKSGIDANVPNIANCQSCHTSSQARVDCVACHTYHPRSATEVATTLWR